MGHCVSRPELVTTSDQSNTDEQLQPVTPRESAEEVLQLDSPVLCSVMTPSTPQSAAGVHVSFTSSPCRPSAPATIESPRLRLERCLSASDDAATKGSSPLVPVRPGGLKSATSPVSLLHLSVGFTSAPTTPLDAQPGGPAFARKSTSPGNPSLAPVWYSNTPGASVRSAPTPTTAPSSATTVASGPMFSSTLALDGSGSLKVAQAPVSPRPKVVQFHPVAYRFPAPVSTSTTSEEFSVACGGALSTDGDKSSVSLRRESSVSSANSNDQSMHSSRRTSREEENCCDDDGCNSLKEQNSVARLDINNVEQQALEVVAIPHSKSPHRAQLAKSNPSAFASVTLPALSGHRRIVNGVRTGPRRR